MVIVRGGGDIATGTIHRLCRCGYRVLVLEAEQPTAVRRNAAFCEAVYDGTATVEGITCRRAEAAEQCRDIWDKGGVPVMIDPRAEMIPLLKPDAVIDAVIAKKNLGTRKDMAAVTIALGPGFCAGTDVHYVIETMRGHDLGRIIENGTALANTGVPGLITGYGKERVVHAPAAGSIRLHACIGDIVKQGQVLADIDGIPVTAGLPGVLRGMIRDGFLVQKGLKIADIDPRKDQKQNCSTISDKARCIAGSVLEILTAQNVKKE